MESPLYQISKSEQKGICLFSCWHSKLMTKKYQIKLLLFLKKFSFFNVFSSDLYQISKSEQKGICMFLVGIQKLITNAYQIKNEVVFFLKYLVSLTIGFRFFFFFFFDNFNFQTFCFCLLHRHDHTQHQDIFTNRILGEQN